MVRSQVSRPWPIVPQRATPRQPGNSCSRACTYRDISRPQHIYAAIPIYFYVHLAAARAKVRRFKGHGCDSATMKRAPRASERG